MSRRFFPLQFSLRTLLVVLMPLTAIFALGVRSREARIVRTGNPLDLAIEGPGYFEGTDQFYGNPRFTRSGQLRVNSNGLLYLKVDGEECYLEPMITIPSDAGDLRETLKVTADGCFRVHSSGIENQLGQTNLHTFPAANLPQFKKAIFAADDETGPPIVWLPGAAPAGQILQGYRELRGWRWDAESIVTLLVGFVLGVVATWLLRGNSAGTSTKTATASLAPCAESPSAP